VNAHTAWKIQIIGFVGQQLPVDLEGRHSIFASRKLPTAEQGYDNQDQTQPDEQLSHNTSQVSPAFSDAGTHHAFSPLALHASCKQ
jgi:hypothetical protein